MVRRAIRYIDRAALLFVLLTALTQVGWPSEYGGRRNCHSALYFGSRETWRFAMHPILLFEPSLALKIVVAIITIVALVLFIRAYWRDGQL